MENDNSPTDNRGHLPGPALFWTDGRLSIIHHCDGVFTAECGGIEIMPPRSFETVTNYLKSEFDSPSWAA